MPVRAVIGNHGLEPSPDAARYHGLVKKWLPQLREALSSIHGLELENKLYSISIHYRRARGRAAARTAIGNAVRSALLARGVAVNRTPITPDYLLSQLLDEGPSAGAEQPELQEEVAL